MTLLLCRLSHSMESEHWQVQTESADRSPYSYSVASGTGVFWYEYLKYSCNILFVCRKALLSVLLCST